MIKQYRVRGMTITKKRKLFRNRRAMGLIDPAVEGGEVLRAPRRTAGPCYFWRNITSSSEIENESIENDR